MCSRMWEKKKKQSQNPLLKPVKHLWKCRLNPHSQFSSWIQFVLFGWRDCSLSSDTRTCWGLTHGPQFQRKYMQKKKHVIDVICYVSWALPDLQSLCAILQSRTPDHQSPGPWSLSRIRLRSSLLHPKEWALLVGARAQFWLSMSLGSVPQL